MQKESKLAVDTPELEVDLSIIGGGINGCGLARDAAGRRLSVELAAMNDLASATSSSTKLLHGGLRYLEYGTDKLTSEIEKIPVILAVLDHCIFPRREGT
tara:strand:+ start:754 stop:1053 length:300 start_codon:yes stop_codon:yes gene_type:complete